MEETKENLKSARGVMQYRNERTSMCNVTDAMQKAFIMCRAAAAPAAEKSSFWVNHESRPTLAKRSQTTMTTTTTCRQALQFFEMSKYCFETIEMSKQEINNTHKTNNKKCIRINNWTKILNSKIPNNLK